MSGRGLARFSLVAAIVLTAVSVGGFIVALVLNTFFLDKYNAYGEVPVPGSASLYLPAGEVTINLHTVVMGSPNGGLPVPPLGVTITPPEGVAQPVVTESIGSTTTVNNDSHVRVWVAQIAASGTYNVTTDGKVNGYIDPRLAFGHKGSYGYLVWLFVATFVAGLVGSIASGMWLRRTRRKAVVAANPYFHVSSAYEPGDEGVRLERLKTLAALRDSGALTQEEFEAEKRRILEGH
ncbi:SHOCT domain-containing protein [Mycobacterium sp.]|uniref:SHOCT domain-containing protein n=1 Tax=Mycobacterium sp. TaxID=1785 RepID=UPI0025D69786|nr:SHOCT domain-containing protein [Mycobacterium sp.]MBW0013492.1 SHOCT domain-containing protein [Mycobacterium sp.]